LDSLPSRCLIIFIMILVTGVLRCFEAAVTGANVAKLQRLAEDGEKSAKNALTLAENPNKFYNSLRVLTVLVQIIMIFEASQFMPSLLFGNHPEFSAYAFSVILLFVFILIFGVYMPKRIADIYADKIVLSVTPLLRVLYFLGLPLSLLLTWAANVFLLIFGIKPSDTDDDVTEEEIRMMVDIGSESGAIDPDEKEMIHNIFELDDTQVRDIMTHRTDTVILWLDEKDSWEETISASNHSIYPVCSESIDNIIGTLNSRDFYRALIKGGDTQDILRPPYFVPETLKADELFRQMQKTKSHFAVVLDEYAGLAGIITMSDLLEEIVGTLSNEYDDQEEEDIVKINENTYKISGSCDIDTVSDTLNISFPDEEYNTFAGLILQELGEIPEDGTTPEIEVYGLKIKVTEIRDHRIEWARVTVLEKVQDNS